MTYYIYYTKRLQPNPRKGLIMNEELKKLIEAETGVKIDGKLSLDDITKVYAYLKPFIDMILPQLNDFEDQVIDLAEGVAMKRSGIRKQFGLAACKALRTALKCPDDDDNVTQK